MSDFETIEDFSDKLTLKKKSIVKIIDVKENLDLHNIWKLLKIPLRNQL